MKKLTYTIISIFILTATISGCSKSNKDKIIYKEVNQEFELKTSVTDIQSSNDPISAHIDSIFNGLIETTIISTGQKHFDLDGDKISDVYFEIIDLHDFNTNLPEHLDSLAARVIGVNIEFIDNSTYGYPDAFEESIEVTEEGNWVSGNGVLGTFANAGNFQGAGERYLAIRFANDNSYNYGWLKLHLSANNNVLRIVEYAYNENPNGLILTGQKD